MISLYGTFYIKLAVEAVGYWFGLLEICMIHIYQISRNDVIGVLPWVECETIYLYVHSVREVAGSRLGRGTIA